MTKTMIQDIEHYANSKPEYAEVLLVYKKVRALQEQVIKLCLAEDRQIDADMVRQRLLAGRPLLQGEFVAIEPNLFHGFAVDLLRILPESWPLRAETRRVLETICGDGISLVASSPPHPADLQRLQPILQDLANFYLADRVGCLETLAVDIGVSLAGLGFALQTLIGPFYERAAQPLRPFLADHLWTKSICPICSSPPQMAKITASGNQRRLGCGLCLTEWIYPRTGCPFCGEGHPDKLPQFHLDNDRGRRVDVCQSCGGYLKTVDERELRRSIHLPVEDIITAHLDLLAQEQGYE